MDNDGIAKRLAEKFGDAIESAPAHRDLESELTFIVKTNKIVEVCDYLKKEEKFNFLSDLCGVHYPDRDKKFEVVYHLFSIERKKRVRLKVRLGMGESVPSVTGVWATADWHERECYDMLGINFTGHPNLKRILLTDDFQGHPLRKDFPYRSEDA
ncbi:MAG: NADH-quinone oxidoreductase subunit C [Candidatus Schekmanbacteria bacterium]|nr:MAG: NADH-quinone oxidoreductase subunit C [Candidatus Schekmanbacteria bacterium]